MRVVLVEDTLPIAQLLKIVLRDEFGHSLTVVTDHFERLLIDYDLWDETDVAVIDRHLPGISGDDIARHVRRIRPEIKLIAYSGKDPDQEARQLYDAYVIKGRNDLSELLTEINSG